MAIASDLKAGQAVRVHGGNAVLESVDAFEMTAVVRREDGVTLTVNTADVSVQTPGETAAMEADRQGAQEGRRGGAARAGVRGPLGDRVVAVPTQGQITAARRVALEAGRREGLGAAKLLDVQDEAEAELSARLGRGEPA